MSAPVSILVLLLLASGGGDAPDWGGFRGNNARGVDETARIPSTLDLDRNLLWQADVPPGYSSPVVAGGHVYLTAAEGKELMTICLDRETGEERWRRTEPYDGKRVGANSGAAPSPAADGEVVCVLFHAVGLIVYNEYGDELWRAKLGPFNIPHGMSSSPVLYRDLVLVLVDQDTGSYLIALDRDSGETRWRVDRPGITHSYSTPVIYEPKDGPPQVIASGAFQINGYNALTGERLWWVRGSAWQTKSVPVLYENLCIVNAYMVPSNEFGIPTIRETWEEALDNRDVDGDGLISREEWPGIPNLQMAWFIFDLDGDDKFDEADFNYLKAANTETGALFAIELGGEGDVTDTHIRWRYDKKRGLPDIPSPVVHDGRLYMVKEGGIVTAIDAATGEVLKQGRIAQADRYFASPVVAGDKLVTASHSGQLTVIQTGSQWTELKSLDLGEETWATPALAGDHMFVRTMLSLYCFGADADE